MSGMDYTDKLIITNYTDPICGWCWGMEPVFRRLETHYPDAIEFRHVMGGLVVDRGTVRNNAAYPGAQAPEVLNREIMDGWLEAARRHGMPVEPTGFHLMTEKIRSSYPQCIAYKAAQLVNPSRADLFLWNIRAATAAEARATAEEEVLGDIAEESGLATDPFFRHLHDGSARRAFDGDLALTRSLGIGTFPTLMVKYNSNKILVRGFQDFAALVSVIDQATDGDLFPVTPRATDDALMALMDAHPRLAAEEIQQAFHPLTPEKTHDWALRLTATGALRIQPAGTSYFVVRAA